MEKMKRTIKTIFAGLVLTFALIGIVKAAELQQNRWTDMNNSVDLQDYVTRYELNAKEPTVTSGTSGQYWRGDKTWQTLPSVVISSVYNGSTPKTGVKMIVKTAATTTGGIATYYLTSDGTSGGSALCSNVYDESIDHEVNDSDNSYRYSWSLSGDNKTLTTTVTRQAPTTILGVGVLGALNATPNSTNVRLTVLCD